MGCGVWGVGCGEWWCSGVVVGWERLWQLWRGGAGCGGSCGVGCGGGWCGGCGCGCFGGDDGSGLRLKFGSGFAGGGWEQQIAPKAASRSSIVGSPSQLAMAGALRLSQYQDRKLRIVAVQ